MSSWFWGSKDSEKKASEAEKSSVPPPPPTSSVESSSTGMFGGLSVKQKSSVPATVEEDPVVAVGDEKMMKKENEASTSSNGDVQAKVAMSGSSSSLFANLSVRQSSAQDATPAGEEVDSIDKDSEPVNETPSKQVAPSAKQPIVASSAFSFLGGTKAPAVVEKPKEEDSTSAPEKKTSTSSFSFLSGTPKEAPKSAVDLVNSTPVDLLSGLNNVAPTAGIVKKRSTKRPGFARRESSDVSLNMESNDQYSPHSSKADSTLPEQVLKATAPKAAVTHSPSSAPKGDDTVDPPTLKALDTKVPSEPVASGLSFLKTENTQPKSVAVSRKPPRIPTQPQSEFQRILYNFHRNAKSFMKNIESLDNTRRGCSKESTLLFAKLEYLRKSLSEAEASQEQAMEREDFEQAEQVQREIDRIMRDIYMAESNIQRLKREVVSVEEKRIGMFGEEVVFVQDAVSLLGDYSSSKSTEAKDYLVNTLKALQEKLLELEEEEEILALDKENISKDLDMILNEQRVINAKIDSKTTDLRSEREGWSVKRDAVTAEIEELRRQLAAKESEKAEYDNEIAVLDESINSISSKFGSRLGELKEREHTYREREEVIQNSYDQLSESRQQVEQSRESAHKRARQMEESASAMVSQLIVVEKLIERLVSDQKIRTSEGDLLKNEEAEVDAMQQECNRNKKSIEVLQHRIEKLETDLMDKKRILIDIDALIPGLNEQKKLAVSTRNFKEAGAVSAKIKEMNVKREECLATVESTKEDYQTSSDLLAGHQSANEALAKSIVERESKLQHDQLKVIQAKRVLIENQMKEVKEVTPETSEDDISFGKTLLMLLEAEANSYKVEAQQLAERLGDPDLCMLPAGTQSTDSGSESSPQEGTAPGEEPQATEEKIESDTNVELAAEENSAPKVFSENKISAALRIQEIIGEVDWIEKQIDAAVEDEDYDLAAELDSKRQALDVEQAELMIHFGGSLKAVESLIANGVHGGDTPDSQLGGDVEEEEDDDTLESRQSLTGPEQEAIDMELSADVVAQLDTVSDDAAVSAMGLTEESDKHYESMRMHEGSVDDIEGDVEGTENEIEENAGVTSAGFEDGDIEANTSGTEDGDVAATTGTEDGDVAATTSGTEDGDVAATTGTEDGDVAATTSGTEDGDFEVTTDGTEDGDDDVTATGTKDGDVEVTTDGIEKDDVEGTTDGIEKDDVELATTRKEEADAVGIKTETDESNVDATHAELEEQDVGGFHESEAGDESSMPN